MSAQPTQREVVLSCVFAVVTALMCAALLAAAALVPAPTDVLPFVIAASVGMPMLAAWHASASISLRRRLSLPDGGDKPPLDRRALGELRRQLAELPEIRHPLDL